MFSKGKTNPEIAIKLDIPQTQVTQFRLEYWRLQDQDDLESLHIVTKGKARHLWKLYQKLVIEKGMSLKAVANVVDIALDRLLPWKIISTKPSEQQLGNKRKWNTYRIVYTP